MGTPMMVDILNHMGSFPTHYWHRGKADHVKEINAPALHERCRVTHPPCVPQMLHRMRPVVHGQGRQAQGSQDRLPTRFHTEPLPETGKVITKEAMDKLLKDYYGARGWDDQGTPPCMENKKNK